MHVQGGGGEGERHLADMRRSGSVQVGSYKVVVVVVVVVVATR